MTTEWSLDELYKGFDDPAYGKDVAELTAQIDALATLLADAGRMQEKERTEKVLAAQSGIAQLFYQLSLYVELRQSVNTEDGTVMAENAKLMKLQAKMAPLEAAAGKLLAGIRDVDALAKESGLVREHTFYLKEKQKEAKHLLSDEVEEMVASMNMSGGAAWSKLQSYLTSTVKVDYQGKQITLSEVRNLAYSPEASVRKSAYEAEIAAYEKVEDAIAFSLNYIKNQVTMLSEKRGYASPLAMTLEQSRMKRETLDAMMAAIDEYLPVFRKYLRKKGGMLGHVNGLPWYDLFAPLGKADKTYSIEETKQYLIDTFTKLTPEMADLMREAFENEWIDFYPRKGKEGGAFCAGAMWLKQSRILTNYDGYFGSVDTLAHELGHAFHNRQIENHAPLNQDYPMPVAETASTFNEVHLGKAARAEASGEELLNLLENDIKEQTQCIVDIYSRYLFETAVFEQSQNKFLMADDLKQIMLDAQKKTYGDGLDPECMHPYMWVCKGHYYSEGLSFYNFPYAFGNLFALGLYSQFEKEGEAFIGKYKAMLSATPCCTIEEAGAMMGIDLTKKDFWRTGLSEIAEEIEQFCTM